MQTVACRRFLARMLAPDEGRSNTGVLCECRRLSSWVKDNDSLVRKRNGLSLAIDVGMN